jgi:CP family cyanate transporter-like MFS transporter
MDETTGPSDGEATAGPARRSALLLAALLLVALNLRPAITSVGPLIDDVRDELRLSSAAIGLLTTGPLIAFGVVAPLGPPLSRRLGIERALLGCLLALAGGLALRLPRSIPLLYLGTLLAGCAIALANVLLPALVKRRFGRRAAFVTGLYSMALGAGAALAAALAVPSERWLGGSWRGALALWALPPLVAAVCWLPQLRPPTGAPAGEQAPTRARPRLRRDRIAWHVTAAMGTQSLLFYTTAAWLPDILRSHGVSSATAGALLSLMLVLGIPAGFLVALAAGRLHDQRPIALAAVATIALGYAGLLLAPRPGAALWTVLLGGGEGAFFTLTLTVMVLRAPDTAHAAALSGMAQSAGYLLAALGPVAIGALHDLTGSWTLPVATLLAFTAPALLAALGASRSGHVGAPLPSRRA